MAEIQIDFQELVNRELPKVCIGCGRPSCGFVVKEYSVQKYTTGWRWRRTETRSRSIPIPVCKRHLDEDEGTEAVALGARSILLDGVSPRFVDALWDLRDELDREAKRSFRRRRRAYDEDDDPLFRRGTNRTVGWVIGITLGIVALCFALCVGLAGLVTAPMRSGPGLGPGGGPPFGPGGGGAPFGPPGGPPFGPGR
jgi:hypothetical protein